MYLHKIKNYKFYSGLWYLLKSNKFLKLLFLKVLPKSVRP